MSSVTPDLLERWVGDGLAASAAVEEEQGIDHFDRLPDSILLVIFNQISDVKALGRCYVVSRRFHSLIPLVDTVSVRIDCVISDDLSTLSASSCSSAAAEKTRSILSHFARVVLGGIVRPIYALGQILSSSSSKRLSYAESSFSEVSHYSPSEVLKNFKEIRRLRIELPAGELGVNDGVLLKWKASFGSTINSCVILGASSVLSSSSTSPPTQLGSRSPSSDLCGGEDNASIPESFYTNGGLKLRVVWTISSLIAASARHYLLQPIVRDHKTLEFLDLTDADGQGVLSMNRRQLQELTMNPVSASGSSQRTLMPALSMRLWYEPQLEIPCGMMLKGATLVVIQPSEEKSREMVAGGSCNSDVLSDLSWVLNAFQEPYCSAARLLMEKRPYCLEMNSF
ncbi:F-box protein At5g46170-like [Phalaenopsis equestris]|uniref:F-box protein At5g46170-like n=1 Tax=Phalaenopsis equestris TaxID=78828 RepID=UPI0009E1F620|nr:F-box protein At5g46170-like [Phalaenopsis equestris]